ncbi:hypothetical protein [Providencia stuartii]|uniref:hypothetical protein n=1 Tax=Providencia stuartii TaxID=588 RepID=UPI002AA0B3AD|nr:hypothetical protein [Providencia stuartii]
MKKIGDITNTADKNGEFTDGNVAAGTPPTQLMGAWFNSVQREILNVLAKAGISQSATKEDQLAEAIIKIISKGDYAEKADLKNKVDIAPVNLNGNDTIANQLRGGLGSCMRASAPYPSDSPTQSAFKIIQIGSDEWPTLLAFDAYGRKLWITTRKSSKGELDDWIELTNFVTPEALSELLSTKFDKDNISQQLANDVNKVPSLDLFVKELAKKLSSVPDATTGVKGIVKLSNRITDSGADTVPTSALAAYLNVNKVGISDITNDIGISTTKILNQKATTERLFGISQTWRDVTSSRAQGTNYTNSSSKAIQVVITAAQSSAQVAVNLRLTITGVGSFQSSSFGSNADACVTCIIPPSASYSVSASGGSGISITKWLELS